MEIPQHRFALYASIIFLMAGTAHALRIINDWTLFVGPYYIPKSMSALAVFIALVMLSAGLAHANETKGKKK